MEDFSIKKYIILVVFIVMSLSIKAQLTDGMTGLLHMPNAEMQKDGTFMIGSNYLSWKNVPFIANSHYKYNTFNYYLNVTLFKFLEISYICTLNKGIPNSSYWPKQTWEKFTNQDRHFAAKVKLLSEGQLVRYMPAIVVGVSDPTTGDGSTYTDLAVEGSGNGYFNRWYIAATKHFDISCGTLGVNLAYLYNNRTDNPLNSPAIGISYIPNVAKNVKLIAEYDAKNFNIGTICSFYNDHINFIFELQDCQYLSFGLLFKINLLGNNNW